MATLSQLRAFLRAIDRAGQMLPERREEIIEVLVGLLEHLDIVQAETKLSALDKVEAELERIFKTQSPAPKARSRQPR